MSNLTQYQFNNEISLRILEQEWFIAGDVCKGLEILDSAQAVRQIQKPLNDAGIKDAFSKRTLINTTGGKQNVVCVNEAGLNLLIMQSRKKEAIRYKWWIASEVLPTIRKTGSYSLTINTEQKYQIRKAVNERVHRTGEKHQAIYHKLYDQFKINSYEALPANKFDEAIRFLGGINNKSHQFSDDELCTLAWCYKAGERMRKEINLISDALYKLKSDFAPSFYSMGVEYTRTLENTRIIIERETRHINPDNQSYLSNNWINVLPVIRQTNQLR